MIHVLIVDDHPTAREGLKLRIALEQDMQICGEAEDVDTALRLLVQLRPQIAIVDLSLKTDNGLELFKMVQSQKCGTRMLAWSMYDESLYAERALRAGAMGYVHKSYASDQIITAIRTIRRGEIFLSPETKNQMLHRAVYDKQGTWACRASSLSDRELHTFELIGRGLSTAAIAKRLQLSPKTIESYRAGIKDKLGLEDMAALTRDAVQWVLKNG